MHLIFSPEKLITHGTIVCKLYVKFMCFTYPAAILWKNTMNDGGTQQNNTRPLYDSYLLALFAWGSVIGDILMYPVIRKRSLMLGGVNMIRYWWKNVINERRNKKQKKNIHGRARCCIITVWHLYKRCSNYLNMSTTPSVKSTSVCNCKTSIQSNKETLQVHYENGAYFFFYLEAHHDEQSRNSPS